MGKFEQHMFRCDDVTSCAFLFSLSWGESSIFFSLQKVSVFCSPTAGCLRSVFSSFLTRSTEHGCSVLTLYRRLGRWRVCQLGVPRTRHASSQQDQCFLWLALQLDVCAR